MFDAYDGWLINIIGNITMFIPVGFVWPFCFKKLDTIGKVVLAGGGLTLFIELTQLPFYARCSDIDDLIMNTTGVFIGAIIYFGAKHLKHSRKMFD
jgi:glycopeptide antibiotics resistance protein